MSARVEDLIDELDDLVKKSWGIGGRTMVDSNGVEEILEEIREALPQEIRKARVIVADRNVIINEAKREAEKIVRVAEEHARAMVAKDEIVREAQAKANDLISQSQAKANDLVAQSQAKAREIRRAADEYLEDLMKRTDEQLTANLAELRKTRQNLKASQKSRNISQP